MNHQSPRPKFDLIKFEAELNAHQWSFLMPFEEASFYSFRQAVEKEKRLFDQAMRNGIAAIESYKLIQEDALRAAFRVNSERIRAGAEIAEQKMREYYNSVYERDFPTGDEEFDNFRKMVINFDSTYQYSDDINAYRRGRDQNDAIQAVLKKMNDPKYQQFYQYFTKKYK